MAGSGHNDSGDKALVVCDECGSHDDVNSFCIGCHVNICDICTTTQIHRNHNVLPRTHPEVIQSLRSSIWHPSDQYERRRKSCKFLSCVKCLSKEIDENWFTDIDQMHALFVKASTVRTINLPGIYNMIYNKDDTYWCYMFIQKTLVLYDASFTQIKTVELDCGLRDMALLPPNDIIATEFNNQRLVRITQEGIVTEFCSTVPLIPDGVCVNDRGHIVVALFVEYAKPPIKLVIYSADGSTILHEIKNDEDGKPLFTSNIYRVTQNGNGDYIACDDNRVVCVSREGELRWTYKVPKRGPCVEIQGIVCDRFNNVIIAENHNDKITLLDSEANMAQTLFTKADGVSSPRSLSIDNDGLLYITLQTHVKVVKYLK